MTLASLLVYKPSYGDTGVAIFSQHWASLCCTLCFPVASVWICSKKIVERSLKKLGITSPTIISDEVWQIASPTLYYICWVTVLSMLTEEVEVCHCCLCIWIIDLRFLCVSAKHAWCMVCKDYEVMICLDVYSI